MTTYAPVAVTAAGYAVGSGLGASTWLSAGVALAAGALTCGLPRPRRR